MEITQKQDNSVIYLAKVGELTLKGSNIREFERRLIQNVRSYLAGTNAVIQLRAGRMYIECQAEFCAAAEYTLRHLIGITGWARAILCEKTIESIKAAVMQEARAAKKRGAKTFKIEARRSDKSFALTSYDICRQAAEDVFDQGILAVDVHNPDTTITVEVRERCFVYADAHKGCRGLPPGTGGKGVLLLSGGLDSPVAGYRMMRRGMRVECVYFHAYPYTSAEAQEKVEKLAQIIAQYGIETHINIIPFTAVQMRIKEKCRAANMHTKANPDAFTTLMLRVCMIKAANLLASRIRAQCLITGESLGQVASQTIENMAVTESACDFPLLRPLVGMDKEEIVETAKRIGTYETSILPYEDCCVLFSPKHPVLHADLAEAKALYESLEADALIQEAFDKREIKSFSAKEYVNTHFLRAQE